MDRQWKTRSLGLVALLILSGLMMVPTIVDLRGGDVKEDLPEWYTKTFSQRMILGLDLQGGIHLQYKVDVEEALKRRAGQRAGSIEALMLKDHKLKVTAEGGVGATLDEVTTLKVKFPSEADTGKLDQDFILKNLGGYSISDITGDTVTLVMKDDAIESFRNDSLEQAIDTIERRINEFGVAESTISRRGDSELVVQLPGIEEKDFAQAKEKLSQTGHLHFQIVEDDAPRSAFYTKIAARQPKAASWPEGLDEKLKTHVVVASGNRIASTSREILEYMVRDQVDGDHVIGFQEIFANPKDAALSPISNLSEAQEKALRKAKAEDSEIAKAYELRYMRRKDGMSGENVTDASVGFDQFNRPVVHMTFDQSDAEEFYEMTKTFTNKQMAIMIDEIVYSAPNIREPIPGGRVQIDFGSVGNTAFKEASALVAVLKSGALQAPLRKLYDSQVGPTLGQDSIDSGRMSVVVAFVAVILFMAFYYKFSGLVANLALLLNLVFVIAGLTAFGATLTLPGIAGIVLTVGMAVDANVIIFERIREELRAGVGVRKAIAAGYEKAFSAIFDANITTIIAAAVLYQFGSGPIRGFAVTLAIGIVCSMYTALWVTRLVFDWFYGRGTEPAKMSI